MSHKDKTISLDLFIDRLTKDVEVFNKSIEMVGGDDMNPKTQEEWCRMFKSWLDTTLEFCYNSPDWKDT